MQEPLSPLSTAIGALDAASSDLNQELETRIQSRTRELTLANRDTDAFAHMVSHDLRAPLRHSSGFVTLLRKDLNEHTSPPCHPCGAHHDQASGGGWPIQPPPGQDDRKRAGVRPAGPHHIFWVKDNGAGFDRERATNLFVMFQRQHHSMDFEGTGTGLALSQRIGALRGGTIRADSQPSQGCRVSIRQHT